MAGRPQAPRSDIYSLGCTLHRLLVGQPPYQGETLMRVLLAHRELPIPSLRQLRQDVPEQRDAVFQKMMAKESQDRYQSMGEVIAALEAALAARSGRSIDGAAAKADSSSGALSKSLAFLGEAKPGKKKPAAKDRIQPQVGAARRKPLVLLGLGGGMVLLLGIILTIALRHGTLVVGGGALAKVF